MIKFLSIINLIIAAQALFLVVHFFLKKKGEQLLNQLLGFLCFCFAILSIRTYNYFYPFLDVESVWIRISNHVIWFVGPLLYLYVIYHDRKLTRKLVLSNTTPYIFIAMFDILFNSNGHIINLQIISIIQISIYLLLSIKHSLKNYKESKQFFSWILPSLYTMTFLVSLYLIVHIFRGFGSEFFPNELRRSFTSLLAIPIFYIAYKEMNSDNEFGIKPAKYKSSQLSNETTTQYLKTIEKAMQEEKLFLIKNLTLHTFSGLVKIQSRHISQVINQNLGLSFSEYLLKYRLGEAKKNLLDPDNKNLSIFGIAQNSGFSSNSRFYYLFKKETGLTPKQFKDQKK
ncbi:response regulator transcription factor [uncultured Winogradskyella sp.]|uniref:helix-turn-helix transcriptional regulator n=1 Tax=uncultured Winogradskyella sp. TaxID=395353 RepID=UPI00262682F5|nr:response regulator transcription factor [uncultured Winogradskyella sp.]